jgi:hypothetical protein
VPDLARLVESNAGVLVVARLFLAATDGRPRAPDGTVVPVSISALPARSASLAPTREGCSRTRPRPGW